MNRILALAIKELQQLRRDRLTVAMMFMLPMVQLLVFGYAINTDVRHMQTVVFDQDHSADSRDLASRLESTGFYDIVGEVRSYDEIKHALRSGDARVALVVAPGFSRDFRQQRQPQVQLVVDGSDPQTVGSAISTAEGMTHVLAPTLVASSGQSTGVQLVPTIWYNPEQRTAIYIVPGLIGVILTMTMVMLTAMAVARERERGTLEALIVSPARSIEIVAGKIAPYIVIGYIQMSIVLIAGRLIFDVPVVGSLPLLYVLASLFIAASLAVGLVFSTIATTQQQAMQMSFFFLLPNILLSGFMFPFKAMPEPAQWLAQMLPLTHFLRIVRRIMLKGGDLHDVASEALSLVAILLALVLLASLRFKKKLL